MARVVWLFPSVPSSTAPYAINVIIVKVRKRRDAEIKSQILKLFIFMLLFLIFCTSGDERTKPNFLQ